MTGRFGRGRLLSRGLWVVVGGDVERGKGVGGGGDVWMAG